MNVSINGFGRIGRTFFRAVLDDPDIEVVRINDLVDAETLAYLLKHDSNYGTLDKRIEPGDGEIRIDGKRYPISNEKSPGDLPHEEDGTDVVIDATGLFRKREDAQKHLDAGARKVLITAPAKDEVDGDFIPGVNDDAYDEDAHHIITIGSCTTNCLAPMVKVLHDHFTVRHGFMSTVHAYTNSQELVDGPAKKKTRGRSAADNIVPTTTGAAEMIGKIIPDLDGKLDGMALRVPVPCGSITDLTCVVETDVSAEEINRAFGDYAGGHGKGILAVEELPLVSTDIVGNPFSATILPEQTQVIDRRLVKCQGWYDNEYAFSQRLADMCKRMVGAAVGA